MQPKHLVKYLTTGKMQNVRLVVLAAASLITRMSSITSTRKKDNLDQPFHMLDMVCDESPDDRTNETLKAEAPLTKFHS